MFAAHFYDKNMPINQNLSFKEVQHLTIQGGCFEKSSKLENILARPMNIVFGRNGSGKSSIARAIANYVQNKENSDFNIDFETELSEDAKNNVFIFNEEFVNDNVKVKDDGIKAIVMIGQQVDIDNQIEKMREESAEVLQTFKNKNERLSELTEASNPQSVECLKNVLINKLTANFFERDKLIKGNSKITPRKVDKMKEIVDSAAKAASFSLSELSQEVANGINLLSNSRSGEPVSWEKPVQLLAFDVTKIMGLLQQKVERPELSERDQYILEIAQNVEKHHYIEETRRIIVEEEAERCPLCHQEVSAEHREMLRSQIERMLNTVAEQYKQQLASYADSVTEVTVALPVFPVDKYNDHVLAATRQLSGLNGEIQLLKNDIQKRLNNPYEQLECAFDLKKFQEIQQKVEEALENLKQDVEEYNQIVKSANQLQNELHLKNRYLAYWECKSEIEKYQVAQKEQIELTGEVVALKKQVDDCENEIKGLEAQKKQVKIAMDNINKCLRMVFMENDRLKLMPLGGNKYQLWSRKREVRPDNVSLGERNILGLAYYFASVFANKREKKKYETPVMLVIDDPISSFDLENRLGIISLLNAQIRSILTKNSDSKVLVLSHDLSTVSQLKEIADGIEYFVSHRENTDDTAKSAVNVRELFERDLVPMREENYYQQMLENIFDYAAASQPDVAQSTAIGNQMRRVAETYCTFIYKSGLYALTNPRNLKCAGLNQEQCDYYAARMSRLLLNGESHSSMRVDSETYLQSAYTPGEIQRAAREFLYLLLLLNRRHLESYLSKEQIDKAGAWNLAETE